ncbi:condensin complex subunit 1 [Elysia marginata]|uniref:Condensin complex subunit 1 n=1 Tax=Elysia marginata TaxID=1093978 RepID=A0AAV4GX98_9GAST|nr:condensin complex subunit 1 [Elysia marginata]
MAINFAIPSSRDDLLSSGGSDNYYVEEILTVRQVVPALQALKSVCRGNSQCIVEHFDSLFSILCIQKDLDAASKEEAWHLLLKGSQTFLTRLTSDLDQCDLAREDRVACLNATKMAIYLLCQYLELFDGEATRPGAVATGKGRGKKAKASSSTSDLDWDYERHEGVQLLLSFIHLSLTKLWDPPVAEEEFVSLVSGCCYKLLENPTTSKNKETLVAIAHILGNLIKRYNHGLGNVDAKEAARDAAVGKAYAGFLVEIAEKLPKVVMPTMALLVGHLEGESYTLRNGILGMMGEILTRYICKEELDDKLRSTRDGFFEKLEDHIHDVNAFVRSKVLQIWLTIVDEKCLPLLRQEIVMSLVVGRLSDKSSIVRKNALQLVTALLKSNPFAARLSVEDLRTNYEKEKTTLEEMTPTPLVSEASKPEGEKINQEWAALELGLLEAVGNWSSKQVDTSALIGDEEPSQQILEKIVKLVQAEQFSDALMLTAAAAECYPDCPPLQNYKTQEKDVDDTEEDEAKETEDKECGTHNLGTAIKEVFFYVKQPLVQNEVDVASSELSTEVAKQQTLVQYLKNSLTFAVQVQECIPIICQLLGSKNTTDILEAINFLVTATEFGVVAATAGVRKMMVLVWSQEQTVREAVTGAYRQLYLQPKGKNSKAAAASVVKNLSALLIGCTYGDLSSLETLVCEFVKSGDINKPVIQTLWETFTLKSSSVTEQDARAAVMLISMCARAEPNIAKSNLEVLVQEGLGQRAEKDYLLAQGTCQTLLKITATPRVILYIQHCWQRKP